MLSCGLDGRILFWDIDVNEPVGCFHEADGCKFLCLSVSPGGQFIGWERGDFVGVGGVWSWGCCGGFGVGMWKQRLCVADTFLIISAVKTLHFGLFLSICA